MFHIENLTSMTNPQENYGIIVVGGQRCLIGTLSGDTPKILEVFNVEVNKSQKKGGQSALRYQRIRVETRHNLVAKVAEASKRCYISNGVPNVSGIILAGCAQLKNELNDSELLGDKLNSKVIAIFDVAYDGEQGFFEAIKKSKGFLKNVEYLKEQQDLESLFDYVGKGGSCAFGPQEVMLAWKMNAIKELYVSKQLKTILVSIDDDPNLTKFSNNLDENGEGEMLINWIIAHYSELGIKIHLVSDCSPEGTQLLKGLGGIGAILRYQINFADFLNNTEENNFGENEKYDSDFEDF